MIFQLFSGTILFIDWLPFQAEGEVAALNRRIQLLEEDLGKNLQQKIIVKTNKQILFVMNC